MRGADPSLQAPAVGVSRSGWRARSRAWTSGAMAPAVAAPNWDYPPTGPSPKQTVIRLAENRPRSSLDWGGPACVAHIGAAPDDEESRQNTHVLHATKLDGPDCSAAHRIRDVRIRSVREEILDDGLPSSFSAAAPRGVSPNVSWAFTFAPGSTSSFTTSRCPPSAARLRERYYPFHPGPRPPLPHAGTTAPGRHDRRSSRRRSRAQRR
jgi:hypothetical protein